MEVNDDKGDGMGQFGSGVGNKGERAENVSSQPIIIPLRRKRNELDIIAGMKASTLSPKKLRTYYGSLNRPNTSGKSMAAIQSLMPTTFQDLHRMLNLSPHMPSVPFVSEREIGFQLDTSA